MSLGFGRGSRVEGTMLKVDGILSRVEGEMSRVHFFVTGTFQTTFPAGYN